MKNIFNNLINISLIIGLLFIGGCKKTKEDMSKAFVKYYGGLLEDTGVEVLQTGDGGYIIAGTTNTGSGPGDILIIKTDDEGNEKWHKTLGADSVYDECGSIAIMPDGGYMIVGTTEYKVNRVFDVTALEISKDSTCVFAARMDAGGSVIWSKHYTNPSYSSVQVGAFGKSVAVNPNGQCFIAGMVDSSYGTPAVVNLNLYAFLIDYNGAEVMFAGNPVTPFQYGAQNQNDYTNDAILAFDEGLGDEYIISSSTIISGVNTPRLVKVRLNGGSILQNTARTNLSWTQPTYYSGGEIIRTMDQNYMMTGTMGTPPTSSDIFMIKLLATDLSKITSYSYGDHSGFKDLGVSVTLTNDGGYALLGVTNSTAFTGDATKLDDVLLIKVDGNGNEQWHKTFGGRGNDSAAKIIQTSDGGYLICGTISFGDDVSNTGVSNSITLIKVNSDGNLSNVK